MVINKGDNLIHRGDELAAKRQALLVISLVGNAVVGCHVHAHTRVGGWAKRKVREGETQDQRVCGKERGDSPLPGVPSRSTLVAGPFFPTVAASILRLGMVRGGL